LAALALLWRRDARAWFFGLVALVGLVLALGGYAILHGWFYAFAPVVGQLRAPARFIYLLDFGLAVLAAMGFDQLVRPLAAAQQRAFQTVLRVAPWVFLFVALAAGGTALAILALGQGQDPALYQRIGSAANALFFFILLLALSLALLFARRRSLVTAPLWSVLALALIFFDLFSLGANIDIGLSDPTANYNRQDVVDYLLADGDYYRVDSRGTGVEGAWLPDTAILSGLSDVNGDNPLVLADFERYWQAVGGRDSFMYQRLNVRYVLARRSTAMPSNFKRVFDGASGVSVWENQTWLPRARVVYSSIVMSDPKQTLATLQDPRYDPRQVVLLEKGTAHTVDRAGDEGAVEITGYGPNEIDLKVADGADRYLVLSEIYYPGWHALVDGQDAEVLHADSIFRAIVLSPGPHQVRMIYDPLSFKVGAIISILTLLAVIVVVLFAWRRGSLT
ncbi:MAG: YfhO family protein, partial [Anaerolineae bacterium]